MLLAVCVVMAESLTAMGEVVFTGIKCRMDDVVNVVLCHVDTLVCVFMVRFSVYLIV